MPASDYRVNANSNECDGRYKHHDMRQGVHDVARRAAQRSSAAVAVERTGRAAIGVGCAVTGAGWVCPRPALLMGLGKRTGEFRARIIARRTGKGRVDRRASAGRRGPIFEEGFRRSGNELRISERASAGAEAIPDFSQAVSAVAEGHVDFSLVVSAGAEGGYGFLQVLSHAWEGRWNSGSGFPKRRKVTLDFHRCFPMRTKVTMVLDRWLPTRGMVTMDFPGDHPKPRN